MIPKQALIVVDMQNDFVTGVLGTKEAQAIVPTIAQKIKEYQAAGKPVVYTRDTHFSDTYKHSCEGIHLPVLHCVISSDGWQVVPELDSDGEKINKSTFGSKHLAHWCMNNYIASVEICGVCTDICVISNVVVLKTYLPNIEIYCDPKACAGVTPEKHNAAIEVMKSLQVNIDD